MTEDPMLIMRVITFQLTQLTWPRRLNVTDEQMEDRRTTYCNRAVKIHALGVYVD